MKKFVWLLFGLLLMVSSCMSTKQYELPKKMTGYLVDFYDYSIKYGTYDYYAIKNDGYNKAFYTLDLNNPCILKIEYGELYSYNETNLKEKVIKDLFELADLYSYSVSYNYYIDKGYSELDSIRLAKKDNNTYNLRNWKWESFLDKDEYFGYVINFLKHTIKPAILKADEPINGRFYFQTENGVFSASYNYTDCKWKIEKSDKNLKDYILSHVSWRCQYKDPEKVYEKEYIHMLDTFKKEDTAKYFAEGFMDEAIRTNKEIPYWTKVQNKILEFFEETN